MHTAIDIGEGRDGGRGRQGRFGFLALGIELRNETCCILRHACRAGGERISGFPARELGVEHVTPVADGNFRLTARHREDIVPFL